MQPSPEVDRTAAGSGEQTTQASSPLPPPPPPQHSSSHFNPGQNGALPPITSVLPPRDPAAPSRFRYDLAHDVDRPARRNSASNQPPYAAAQAREPFNNYPDTRPDPPPFQNPQHHSPVTATFPHHSPVQAPQAARQFSPPKHEHQSPISPKFHHEYARGPPPSAPQQYPPQYIPPQFSPRHPDQVMFVRDNGKQGGEPGPLPPPPTPPRADPMSLSSIMSGNDDPPPRPPPSSHSHNSSKGSGVQPLAIKGEPLAHYGAPQKISPLMHNNVDVAPEAPPPVTVNGQAEHAPPYQASAVREGPRLTRVPEGEIQAELARIEALAQQENVRLNDEDAFKRRFVENKSKRLRDLESAETHRRKRRRTAVIQRHSNLFENVFNHAKDHFFRAHEEEAWKEVQDQEISAEKERKKDMQRKRRREKTLASEQAKRAEAIEKANLAVDDDERERLIKEALKHEKKLKQTTVLLQGGTPSKEIREVTPLGPNLEGGTMSSFQMEDVATPVRTDNRKGGKAGKAGGSRLRKTKEQKQAEKDAAAAAQAAIERGEDLPLIAPKEMERLDRLSTLKRQRSFSEDSGMTIPSASAHGPGFEAYTSKAYNQLYDQIWRDLSKKDVGKTFRIKILSTDTKGSNLRKTAQLASKEARRWQLRTNKSQKDVQARAKRSMREMIGFWRRNERDERDQRKLAERQELENAKKAEAQREANRQKRKLNFLITQTELYSHFVGSKVRTEDAERMDGDPDVAVSGQKVKDGDAKAHTIDLPNADSAIPAKVTNFNELDFDADDESALQAAAMANAQNAVKEAQDRARAFNEEPDEDGEMNFQNPTSLQSMDVAQPKMLACQLKEYQLKGLNWLVNLYEQGINGILADEMGLGKTVQSISVMAYLAERHGIWGPFLVIAPASTLHNWVNEIGKFVPSFKVLPYWGTAKERKTLRKTWDRRSLTYKKNAEFHVMVSSYQLVVQDTAYFQKMTWQYMILDEAQAIKSSNSSRWKSLLNFHCRNRLLLTGTPIQNNMQELWALLHFIMPSLFDSHDEFSEWFSKDIESHAQSNTKLNEDQLKRLHMILKPFMLRRIKKHVQKELGDKIEEDVFCDLAYRQRAYYANLRNKICFMELIEKAAVGDEQDTATLMNLVMQFRKVCNHPDLFERADTTSPFSFSTWAETASFMREGQNVVVPYSVKNCIEYSLPRQIAANGGRLDVAGKDNDRAGWRGKYLGHLMNIWSPDYIRRSEKENGAFSWLRFADVGAGEAAALARQDVALRAIDLERKGRDLAKLTVYADGEYVPTHAMFNIVSRQDRKPLADIATEGRMRNLLNVSRATFAGAGLPVIEACAAPGASAPPVELYASSQGVLAEKRNHFFNTTIRSALYSVSEKTEELLLEKQIPRSHWPVTDMLPAPDSSRKRFTNISVPSMRRFVSDSGKLATLDALLRRLKEEGHRVLLYFQMTRMIDLMEEYLTYRNYKYVRLDGSTKLEDRRDTVNDFQTRPEIFVFLLSTRAGGLGINLTSADTVIFYDSDWNPTIDSQAMDRAHRLGQTRQVTVYRLITRGTIEERIRKRALQKEEVQRVVITGQAAAARADAVVEFGRQRDRERENRKIDIAMWLADDEQAEEIEKRVEAQAAEAEAASGAAGRRKKGAAAGRKGVSLEEMYHEGEGHFDDASAKPSGAATPISTADAAGAAGTPGPRGGPAAKGRRKGGAGLSKKAKTIKQRLAVADGEVGS